jgi:hypothetical protein
MTNRDLEARLRNVQPPTWPDAHWDTFPAQVVRQLPNPGARLAPAERPNPLSLTVALWAGLAAATCVILALWLEPWHRREVSDALPVAAGAKLVKELAGLFPESLRAVIIEGGENRIVLSDRPAVGGMDPVLIRLCHNGDCVLILTFSGETIELGTIRFEVLTGGSGEVLLLGEDFAWSQADPSSLPHWQRAEATTLPELL